MAYLRAAEDREVTADWGFAAFTIVALAIAVAITRVGIYIQ